MLGGSDLHGHGSRLEAQGMPPLMLVNPSHSHFPRLMSCLRHEEFKEGCEASCNGPYDGRLHLTCSCSQTAGLGAFLIGVMSCCFYVSGSQRQSADVT